MKKNKNKIIVLVIIIGCISLIRVSSQERELTQLEKIIAETFLPVQQVLMEGTNNFLLFLEGISSYPEVSAENNDLKDEIAKMNMEADAEVEYYYENIRLREILELKEQADDELIAAEVVARSIKSWEDILTINKGENDGIKLNDGVMTYNGLIGKVFSVTPNSAKVRLLNDRLAAVAAMTKRTRFPGVIEGIGDGSGLLQLTYLPYDAPIEVNQGVVTSGLGGVIPKGIRIGYVSSIHYNEDGLIKKAIVTPYEDFDRLEEVLVIKDYVGVFDEN